MDRARDIGRYRLVALLARGGQAEIFLAVSRAPDDFGRLVVVKRLDASVNPRFATEMFLDEASLATRLRHPNVIETYETGQVGGEHYIAMEHLDGQTFSRVRRAVPGIPPQVWAWMIAQALEGLDHVHTARDHHGLALGIVHCDVSPQNLFVTYDGRVKLIDFGVARSTRSRWPTELGMLTGKMRYMAPEQLLAREEARSDLFAMGAVLWEVIAQRRLFVGSRADVLEALLVGPIPALSSVVPNVDPELDRIVSSALARTPSARFQSARAMRDALLAFAGRSGRHVTPDVVAGLLDAPFRAAREQKHLLLDLAADAAHAAGAVRAANSADAARAVRAADSADSADESNTQTAPQSLGTDPASLMPRVLPTAPRPHSPPPLALPPWTAFAAGAAAAMLVAFALQLLAGHRRAVSAGGPATSVTARSPRIAAETLSPRGATHAGASGH